MTAICFTNSGNTSMLRFHFQPSVAFIVAHYLGLAVTQPSFLLDVLDVLGLFVIQL